MKSLYWIWSALLADLALFFSGVPFEHSVMALLGLWLAHATFCGVQAAATWFLMPFRYRQPWPAVVALLFCIAFVAPVIGTLAVLLVVVLTLRRQDDGALRMTPQSVPLPEYDVRRENAQRAGQGAIRARLAANVPESVRMKSLLTLQAVPQRVANPILEELLGDETDDVRLLAFGMLDAEEKTLTRHIHQERMNLERKLPQLERQACLRRLAELHWELIYASLAQGELRRYMLGEARRYVDAALACGETHDAGLHFLRGRILLTLGEYDEAVVAIGSAVASGLAEASALPYMAEIAFRRGQFDYVHGVMDRLSELELSGRTRAVVSLWQGHVEARAYDHLTPRAQAVVDFWTGRDSVHNFCDHRIHHHL
jgi:hypothetical protein